MDTSPNSLCTCDCGLQIRSCHRQIVDSGFTRDSISHASCAHLNSNYIISIEYNVPTFSRLKLLPIIFGET